MGTGSESFGDQMKDDTYMEIPIQVKRIKYNLI